MMADKDDYLSRYKQFFENFAAQANPDDQLPVKVASNLVTSAELTGEILDWTIQYLNDKKCPPSLLAPLCRIVLSEVLTACSKQPVAFGYRPDEEVFAALRLMQTVLARVIAVCLRYTGDGRSADPASLPAPPSLPPRLAPAFAVKNTRRSMEDRHVIFDDLNSFFDITNTEPTAFYAVYDGHAGSAAAAYSAAHLHQYFVESPDYSKEPRRALYSAFQRTDFEFVKKSDNENLSSGTTAAVIVIRGKHLHAAWVGDSQALLVKKGKLLQLVVPHKPSRLDEKTRIEQEGGCVMYWGTWRVNGQLAVSRAIGDSAYKPYVTSKPDIATVTLDGDEDFVILACDGLWDFVSEDEAAVEVYRQIQKSPDDLDAVSRKLVQVSKEQGSTDNISVIVVFLKEPREIAASTQWHQDNCPDMEAGLDNSNNAQSNAFLVNSNPETAYIKDNLLLDLADGFKQQNGKDISADLSPSSDHELFSAKPTNGKRRIDDEDDELDLGPETDVDGEDTAHFQPPAFAKESVFLGDLEIQRQQTSEFEPERVARDETPTPPADAVLESGAALVENVAESGEDSEDEWNYYKGDQKDTDELHRDRNLSPAFALGENDTISEDEIELESNEMNSSPLNPEAAPFVPISPTRVTVPFPEERPSIPSRLLDDEIVAESPKKPVPMDDIVVPDAIEFNQEAETKPSELGDDLEYMNGHSEISGMSSQENNKENAHGNEKQDNGSEFGDDLAVDSQQTMSEVFLGQDIPTELDFDRVQKDTTDFCDIQVSYVNPSQTFDGVVDEELFERLKSKERDPMSMSFYQEKDEDTCEGAFSSNPFDLNAVQLLPSDEDDGISNGVKDNDIYTNDNLNFTNNFVPDVVSADVTSSEINEAINDLENAVHHEVDLLEHSENVIPSNELLMPGITLDELQSPIDDHSPSSDNVSQLTEPSEADLPIEHDFDAPSLINRDLDAVSPIEIAVSRDSALSKEMSSPPASPFDNDVDLCQVANSPIPDLLESTIPIAEESNLSEQLTEINHLEKDTIVKSDIDNDSDFISELQNDADFISEPPHQLEPEETRQETWNLPQNIDIASNNISEHDEDNSLLPKSPLVLEDNNENEFGFGHSVADFKTGQELVDDEVMKVDETKESSDFEEKTDVAYHPFKTEDNLLEVNESIAEEINQPMANEIPEQLQHLDDIVLEVNNENEVEFDNSVADHKVSEYEFVENDSAKVDEAKDSHYFEKIPEDAAHPFKIDNNLLEVNESIAQEICQPVAHEIPEPEFTSGTEFAEESEKISLLNNRTNMDGNEVIIPSNINEHFDPHEYNRSLEPGDPRRICICPCPPSYTYPEKPLETLSSEPSEQLIIADSYPQMDAPPPTPAVDYSHISLPSSVAPFEIAQAVEKLSPVTEDQLSSEITSKDMEPETDSSSAPLTEEPVTAEIESLLVQNAIESNVQINGLIIPSQDEANDVIPPEVETNDTTLPPLVKPNDVIIPPSINSETDNILPSDNIQLASLDVKVEESLNKETAVPIVAAVVAGSVAIAAVSLVSSDKKTSAKPKSTTSIAAKKTPTSKTAIAASKPLTSPTKASTPKATSSTPKLGSISATKKSAPSPLTKAPISSPKPAPKTATAPTKPIAKTTSVTTTVAKPRVPATTNKPPTEKKPLTNGDVKVPIKKTVVSAPSLPSKTAASKPTTLTSAALKPPTQKNVSAVPNTRSLPASKTTSAIAASKTKTDTAPLKPKPPLSSISNTKGAPSRSAISNATKPAAVATKPSAPPADKLTKETTNRQISAKPPAARPAPIKATESKSSTTLKTTLKTSTAGRSTTATNVKRSTNSTTASKAKSPVKTTETKPPPIKRNLQNGPPKTGEILQVGQGDITVNGSSSITDNEIFLKDNSPQQVDNSLLPVLDVAAN